MQIDFHHAVTYVLARAAGFEHDQAEIVAYSAQYVDDATASGAIRFDNKAMYSRISSAHKSVDLKNLDNSDNLMIWVPFHFLPGNGGKPAGQDPEGSFIRKIVCKPGSYVARDMVEACIRDQAKPYGLHRLGVTMHVYADTWAHQGFAGVLHEINDVDDAEDTGRSGAFGAIGHVLGHILEHTVPMIGHGQARELPDMPFLSWTYRNRVGDIIARDNTSLFCEAADEMCKAMQRFRRKDPQADVPGLNTDYMDEIQSRMAGMKIAEAAPRHQRWLADIANGAFPFGRATVAYDEWAWKCEALGIERGMAAGAGDGDSGGGTTVARFDAHTYRYREDFLTSNWKMFHDAVQMHRLTILHDILPKYGICSG